MTIDSAWFIGVGAFVFVAWLAWTVVRTRRRAGRAEPTPADPSPVVGLPPAVATPVAAAARGPGAPPAAAPTFVERRIGRPQPVVAPSSSPAASSASSSSAPSPESSSSPSPSPSPSPPSPSSSSSRRLTAAHRQAVAPSSPTRTAAEAAPPPEAPSSRVEAPSVERVLWLAPAVAAEWAAARPLRLPAGSLAAVGAALARAAATAPSATWAVCFAEGAAWAMARGDVAFMTTLAAANKDAASGAPRASTRDMAWLDAGAASELAAVVLAALARERHLDALVDEARMLRAEVSALPPGALAEAAAPLLTVAQDVARLARDVHGGFATMIRKAASRGRVAESAAQSAVLWQAGTAGLDAVRQQLVVLTRAARFGEAQLDRAVRRGREWRDLRRLQDLGAQLLAASHLLALATGELRAVHGERLQSAAASLRAGQDHDRELGERLRACEHAAQGDPHERRGEFEARRLQLRQLLDGLDVDAVDGHGVGARRIVAVARQVEAEQASPALTVGDLLLRLGDGGTVDEVRLP